MPGVILYLERKKKQKHAPWNCFRDDFFAGESKQLDTSCLWYSIKCQTREVPEVICAKRHTTTCVSRHIFKVACSRLRDSGGKSFSNKKCEKRAEAGPPPPPPPPPPFPSRARLIFALLVLIRSYYTIWEPGTGYIQGGCSTCPLKQSHKCARA